MEQDGLIVGFRPEALLPDEMLPDKDCMKTARFFRRVVARTARLAAQWMAAGFVHGVLNTDNMNVRGESFDYGPWRFLPTTDFSFTAAYFDPTGLYAYGRQPEAALWNLTRFGGPLVAHAPEESLNASLQGFNADFEWSLVEAFFARLGVTPAGEGDFDVVIDLLRWMEKTQIPFERVFFDWFCGSASEGRAMRGPLGAHYEDADFAKSSFSAACLGCVTGGGLRDSGVPGGQTRGGGIG